MSPRASLAIATTLLMVGGLAACTDQDAAVSSAPVEAGPVLVAPDTGETPAVDDPALDAALSTPVEDSVYPAVGDPGVDALHYDLGLAWDPQASVLTGHETLVFRATADDTSFQLDFSPALAVTGVLLDGQEVEAEQQGKDLVVVAPVEQDVRYTLVVDYAGTPEPVPAPTTRSDFDTNGWTTMRDGSTWTMQEPSGAYSWYAVNDQPADKALYDITVSVPAPAQGIANGVLESTTTADGVTTNSWHLDEPAASYLVTVATGDYTVEEDVSSSGVPLQYWAPTQQRRLIQGLRQTADGLDWLEEKLGPYPFDSLGVLLVDSRSGMETQTMITLGMTDYTTSGAVLVHEAAHQWYGDLVTPSDWRDVWMNEGMAMYLQANWSAEEDGQPLDATLDYWASIAPQLLRDGGPAAAYDPATFGTSNIYYVPALMWHELRLRLGTDRFWSLVRAWPEEHAGQNADYDEITTWWEEQTGLELTAFFDSWLLGDTLPARA